MNIRLTAALAALLFCLRPACNAAAQQPGPDQTRSLWMTLLTKDRSGAQYLQLWQDGTLLSRVAKGEAAQTRLGAVPAATAKEFFRLLEDSDILEDSAVRYQYENLASLELLEISAYRYGDLRYARLPLQRLGKSMKQLLMEIRQTSAKLPVSTNAALFLCAVPLSKEKIAAEEGKMGRSLAFTQLETAVIEDCPLLATSLYRPRQLVPLPAKTDEKQLLDFITEHEIKNFRDKFYLDTPRGKFRVEMLVPNQKP